MDPELRFFVFLVAVLCFAWGALISEEVRGINLTALGLGLFVVPFMWDAAAAW